MKLLIDGVKISEIKSNDDERGYLREIVRADERLLEGFGQVMVSRVKQGVIKAFHWHKLQDDLWYLVEGRVLVVLHDLRNGSKTSGKTQSFIMSEDKPVRVLIPKGVAHGYKVLGDKAALVLYVVTRPYSKDKPDEQRIPFDDKGIGFDWSKGV